MFHKQKSSFSNYRNGGYCNNGYVNENCGNLMIFNMELLKFKYYLKIYHFFLILPNK